MNFDLTVEDLALITKALEVQLESQKEELYERHQDFDHTEAAAQDIIDCVKLLKKLDAIQRNIEQNRQEEAASVEGGEADESGC